MQGKNQIFYFFAEKPFFLNKKWSIILKRGEQMKVAAIICEYNPFHNGHQFHIEETRRKTGANAVVAIMSGNFLLRLLPVLRGMKARLLNIILSGRQIRVARLQKALQAEVSFPGCCILHQRKDNQ